MKAVLGFLELYLHDAPDDEEDNLSIDAASYSSRTTTSTSGACGANDSPNTSAGGGVGGGGVHGPGMSFVVRTMLTKTTVLNDLTVYLYITLFLDEELISCRYSIN